MDPSELAKPEAKKTIDLMHNETGLPKMSHYQHFAGRPENAMPDTVNCPLCNMEMPWRNVVLQDENGIPSTFRCPYCGPNPCGSKY